MLGKLLFQIPDLKLERLSFGRGTYLSPTGDRSLYMLREKCGFIDHAIGHPFVVEKKLRIALDALVHDEPGVARETPGVHVSQIGVGARALDWRWDDGVQYIRLPKHKNVQLTKVVVTKRRDVLEDNPHKVNSG